MSRRPNLPNYNENAPEAAYEYLDETGELLYIVGRYPGKEFPVLRLVDDRWVWKLGDARRIPYRLPQVLEHIAASRREPIYVVEGEKDVEAIEAAGGIATCNLGGAGKWRVEDAETLQGARRVIVVADRDETGRQHALQVVESLAKVGVAAELVEAADGKDAADHLAAGRTLDEFVPVETPRGASTDEQALELRIVPFSEFAGRREPSSEPLIGTPEETVCPVGGTMLLYGDGGASKTTLAIDAVAHWAAGILWLGIPTLRPVRILIVENEGPRGKFREKLDRKRRTWTGPPFEQNVFVLDEPWGGFSFALEQHREQLAEFVAVHEVDLIVAGPLAELGHEGGGTPDSISEFVRLVEDVRRRLSRPLALLLVHHENKAGDVSGAWERVPDTLVHVRLVDQERTGVTWRKARWASALHGRRMTLGWAIDCEGFELLDDGAEPAAARRAAEELHALDWIVDYVVKHHEATGTAIARGRVEAAYTDAHGGRGRNLARRVIDRELKAFEQAQAGEGTGEYLARLATGTGQSQRGTYLVPASYADSPLAEGTSGESGESPTATLQEYGLADSPTPYWGEASGGETGEGGGTVLADDPDRPHTRGDTPPENALHSDLVERLEAEYEQHVKPLVDAASATARKAT